GVITIRLNADDMSNLRFAFRPMRALSASYWTVVSPSQYAAHLPWFKETHAALEAIDLTYTRPMITPDGQFVHFITPIASTPRPSFADELANLKQTPPERIVHNVRKLRIQNDTAQEFLDDPQAALAALVAEVELYWQRALAHHWPRIHAVLEGDVIYRARRL